MKNQKTQSKLLVAMSAVILLLVALSATLTFAWFTAGQTSSNAGSLEFGKLVMKAGSTVMSVSATGTSQSKLVPGSTLSIGGKATIESNIDYYVRAKFVVDVTSKNGTAGDLNLLVPAEHFGTYANVPYNGTFAQDVTHTYAQTYQGMIMAELFNSIANNTSEVLSDYFNGSNWITATSDTSGYKYYKNMVAGTADDLLLFDFSDTTTEQLDQNTYGNAWQEVTITVSLVIDAIQADNLKAGATAITKETTLDATKAATLSTADAWSAARESGIVAQQNP